MSITTRTGHRGVSPQPLPSLRNRPRRWPTRKAHRPTRLAPRRVRTGTTRVNIMGYHPGQHVEKLTTECYYLPTISNGSVSGPGEEMLDLTSNNIHPSVVETARQSQAASDSIESQAAFVSMIRRFIPRPI